MRNNDEQAQGRDNRLVFLVGFMGAGKTTVGRELARILDFNFYDLDEIIEKQATSTVKEIFAAKGESGFRRMEQEAIWCCAALRDSVIALGGGAFVSEENRAMILASGKSVWLDCPLETCLERVGRDQTRPLLGSKDEMRLLLQERVAAYSLADFRVDSSGQSPAKIAAEIARAIFDRN